MSEKVRIPFTFHLRSIRCVSPEEAARLAPSNGIRLGPNDIHFAAEQVNLYRTPEYDRLARRALREYAEKREAARNRAQLLHAIANAAYLPRDIPPGVSRPAASIYQNILPPRQASSSPDGASSNGATPAANNAAPPTSRLTQSLYRTIRRTRQASPPSAGDPGGRRDATGRDDAGRRGRCGNVDGWDSSIAADLGCCAGHRRRCREPEPADGCRRLSASRHNLHPWLGPVCGERQHPLRRRKHKRTGNKPAAHSGLRCSLQELGGHGGSAILRRRSRYGTSQTLFGRSEPRGLPHRCLSGLNGTPYHRHRPQGHSC